MTEFTTKNRQPPARAPRRSASLPRGALALAAGLVLTLFLFARSDESAAGAAPAQRLAVLPASVALRGAGDEHGLLVTLSAADGSRSDATARSKFTSSDPKVVTVDAAGALRVAGDGSAEVVVECDGQTARVPVTVAESAAAKPPSFRQDVLPVLTKTGCNSGACHGKMAGQNGFKLSLRAYAPEWDHPWLTADLAGRRVNFAAPEKSLLLAKPLGLVPHEGGRRLAPGSRHHRTLVEWLRARAPGPDAAEADAERIEVLPGSRAMKAGESQQLLVRAHYPGGRVRDVTWVTQFFSNDENVVKVSPEGRATSLRAGEAAVRAHFQGQVAVVLFTTPFDNEVSPGQFAAKNNVVDEHVFAKLQALRIPPSAPCDDAAFVRRASLDATGTLPAPGEVRAFVADADPAKRAKLVDSLLASPEFVDFWTLQLADLLQNRKERDHDARGTKGLRSFHGWLRGQVAANRGWDAIARDVLTASGDAATNPQVGYFITTVGEKSPSESDVVDAAAQAFLGTRVGCARCHNHPLEKYTQDDYYHFAAFFSRIALDRKEPAKGYTSLAVASKDELNNVRDWEQRNKALADAQAALAGKGGDELQKAHDELANKCREAGDALRRVEEARSRAPGANQPRTGKYLPARALDRTPGDVAPGEDARAKLAAWMTDPKNELFAGAMVNRLWKHFMAVGLVEPVDDLRSSNPPSNPPLWAALNREFVSHNYDLRHVMRLVLNSRAYQLSSATLPQNELDARHYSHYYARRLPAEVMLDAVSSATGVPENFPGYPVGTRAVQLPEPGVGSYFLSLFGRSDRVTACACERSGDVTLPQLLHLTNGDGLQNKVAGADGRLASLLKAQPDDAKLLEELFLATVSRTPTGAEADAVKGVLAAGDPREEVYRDLFWALLNSKEFAFNH